MTSPNPSLSILIPTVPRRASRLVSLWNNIEDQIARIGANAEILSICDNKQRSIGLKRQSLLDIARGEYVTYIDDDDSVSDEYVARVTEALTSRPDVVVHTVQCDIDGSFGNVEMSVKYAPKDGETIQGFVHGGITRRPPHMLAVWRRELALQSKFPDTNVGEDFVWASRLWPLVGIEAKIVSTIYYYTFRMSLAECEK